MTEPATELDRTTAYRPVRYWAARGDLRAYLEDEVWAPTEAQCQVVGFKVHPLHLRTATTAPARDLLLQDTQNAVILL
jgi:hypothetical protein